jgi:hypothetical protein
LEVARTFPALRIALICGAIALLSAAGVAIGLAVQAMLITATPAAFVLMMEQLAPSFATPAKRCILPLVRDWRGALDDPVHFSRIQPAGDIRAAILAALARGESAGRRLHGRLGVVGVDHSRALSGIALGGMASAIDHWGPSAMVAGLAGVGVLMAPGPVAALILPIVLIGAGIGAAWAFVLQRAMSGAKGGEENIAASAAATVQQAGIALGAATAGLVANASGLDNALDPGSVLRASLWVPVALVAAPLAACAIGVRLNLMVRRSPEQELPAARNG